MPSPGHRKYPWLTKQLLRELYEDYLMGWEKIAVALGLPTATIGKYLQRFGLRRPKAEAHKAHYRFVAKYGPDWVGACKRIGKEVLEKYGQEVTEIG